MFIRKSGKRNKLQRAVFIVLTVLISIGLVVPLFSIFASKPDPAPGDSSSARQQSLADRLAELEAKVKENPGDTRALMNLAEGYLSAGSQDQALLTYGTVIAREPDNLEARMSVGIIDFYAGKNDQSIASFQEVLKRDPENKEAHYWYGIVLGAGKKDYAGGVQMLEKYVELAKTGIDVEKAKQTIEEWKAAANK
jgi:cytochrome c-type biogenesis protein CcmH/NrfG